MNRFYYDLHLHSCLSPCGDADNTPNNIAGMAALSGLDIVALTDHNTCKNCPAFFEAAEKNGIIPIAGMELTTSEDIHVVCLFEKLSDAMNFDAYISDHIMRIKNRPEIFGEQLILNGEDEIIGSVDGLLTVATDISIEDAPEVVKGFRGVCYPAHIDRSSNGIIAVLGTLPPTPEFKTVELRFKESFTEYNERYGIGNCTVVYSSDAHYLTDIEDAKSFFDLDAEKNDPNEVRQRLLKILGGRL